MATKKDTAPTEFDEFGNPVEPAPEPTAEPASESTDAPASESKEPDYYCPGCGRHYTYPQKCTGSPEAPHPPIEVVDASELEGDEHTPAPNTAV